MYYVSLYGLILRPRGPLRYRTTGADHIPSSDYCSTALRALLQAAYNVYTQYCNSPSIARDEKEVNDL